ncbi:MAG: hypothetical protein ACLUFT_12140 [Gemmiger formicilis]|uniref:hypothetical protein n=1 Tax=Gemmiger formicilis TaxID=745368 RepID=UPI0039919B4F
MTVDDPDYALGLYRTAMARTSALSGQFYDRFYRLAIKVKIMAQLGRRHGHGIRSYAA